ncbi:MAG TPA: ABC transporter substrate-binding protein [Acidimicrobiia bacterium]|nr:ABC transporter substrate-binding protein [Acidimicrobiia bacterium]
MKRHKLVGALAVLALVLATSSVAVAGTSARPERQTRGVTDDTITVGGLGYAAFYQDSAVGAQARFDKANNNNEIPGGRKINFLGFRDDGSDQNKNLDEGRKLVQDDQIFAAVPVITPFLGASDFFAQNKTPFIGWGIASGFCENPFGFGFSGCLTPEDPKTASSTWGDLIKKGNFNNNAKGKTAAVIAEDNDSGKAGVEVISASAKSAGFKVVYSKNPIPPLPATVSDYTPFANEIMSSNKGRPADVVFLTLAVNNVTGLQNKLLELGYQGVLTNAVGYDPRLATGFVGSSVFIQFNAFESAQQGNTAMQQIIDEIRAVKPDQMLTQPALAGYLSADMFVAMLKKTGKNLTETRFLRAANRNFKYELKDVVGSISFPAGHEQGGTCGTLVESDGTNYTIRVPFDCYKRVKVG